MPTLGAGAITLTDWAKTQDPNGQPARVVELLAQTNPILTDALWIEGNLPTGHRTTVRTGLASASWRLFNQGVAVSKGTSAQIDEACGMLESWSEVDIALAKLNGNSAAFRLQEGQAHLEAMNQEMAGTFFYGNAGTSPEEFNGLATRYSTLGQNVISGGSVSGSDGASIWLVGWGANSVHGVYPKASTGGLQHKDHGEQVIETVAGIGGSRLAVYQDQWTWNCGLVVKDWRYAVRGCNIDISALTAQSSATNLIKLMIRMYHRLPSLHGGMTMDNTFVGIKPVFYMNRTVAQMLDIQRFDVVSGAGTGSQNLGGSIQYGEVDGKWTPTFRGIPIRICDQLLETEATVA